MNIPFIGRRTNTVGPISDAEQNKLLAPKTGPRRGKLLTPGQQNRAMRRQRQRDSAAMAKKSRRNAFKQQQRDFHLGQNVLGMARVYFEGAGTPEMQRNVRGHVDFLAERYSKRAGEPFTTSRKRIEESMLSALVAANRTSA